MCTCGVRTVAHNILCSPSRLGCSSSLPSLALTHSLMLPCSCVPLSTYENNCGNGIDDDCNGLTDKEDPACGLFPVLFSPRSFAWSVNPSLPAAASMSLMAMVFSTTDAVTSGEQTRLRCWALAQVRRVNECTGNRGG